MQRCGQTQRADFPEHLFVYPKLPECHVVFPRRPCRNHERQHRRSQLCNHRCNRNTGNSHPEHRNKHDIEHRVDNRRHHQKVKRPFRITHRA